MAGAILREFGGPHFVMVAGTGERARNWARRWNAPRITASASPVFWRRNRTPRPPRSNWQPLTRSIPSIDCAQLLRDGVIDEIIFSVASETLAQLEDVFLLCDEEGVRTRVAVDFFPHVNSEVYLERLGFTPLLTFSAAPHDEIRLLVKRATDVAHRGRRPGRAAAFHDRGGAAGAAHFSRPGHFQTGPLRIERPPVSVL